MLTPRMRLAAVALLTTSAVACSDDSSSDFRSDVAIDTFEDRFHAPPDMMGDPQTDPGATDIASDAVTDAATDATDGGDDTSADQGGDDAGGDGDVLEDLGSDDADTSDVGGAETSDLSDLSDLADRSDLADASDAADAADIPAPSPLVSLDSSTTYQTMRGWEATTYVGHNDAPNFAEVRDDLFDDIVNEAGVNRVRLEVRSGSENTADYWTQLQNGEIDNDTWRANRYATVNDNGDPDDRTDGGFIFSELDDNIDNVVLPIKSLVEANDETLWINLCYVAFTSQITTGSYVHDDPDEYAEFVLAVYDHLDDTYGWVPDSWEILLEPDNVSQWNGTTIGNALVAASARLTAAGYTPRFVAPSNTNMANAITYFDGMAAVEDAIDNVIELSYHRYGGVSIANLQTIRSRADTWGIDTAHLEWIGAGHEELYDDLVYAENASWSQFVMSAVGPGDPGGALYRVEDTEPRIRMNSRTPFLIQTFRWVRSGAVRIGAEGEAGLLALAWVNDDGGTVVVVRADGAGTFYIGDLPAGDYGHTYSTNAAALVEGGSSSVDTGGYLEVSIPAEGVLTVYPTD